MIFKTAINITIKPYEPLIEKAIKLLPPNYLEQAGVKEIVIEPGSPQHFGKVQSDDNTKIYISLEKIKSTLNNDEETMVSAIAEILAHEVGHLRANFEGGESPADTEELKMRELLKANIEPKILKRAYLYQNKLNKVAIVKPFSSPYELSTSVVKLIENFAQKVKPEKQHQYIQKIVDSLSKIDPYLLSEQSKNPGGGIGATISLVKNLLMGYPPSIVQQTLISILQKAKQL